VFRRLGDPSRLIVLQLLCSGRREKAGVRACQARRARGDRAGVATVGVRALRRRGRCAPHLRHGRARSACKRGSRPLVHALHGLLAPELLIELGELLRHLVANVDRAPGSRPARARLAAASRSKQVQSIELENRRRARRRRSSGTYLVYEALRWSRGRLRGLPKPQEMLGLRRRRRRRGRPRSSKR
jgi:hypothetical protein